MPLQICHYRTSRVIFKYFLLYIVGTIPFVVGTFTITRILYSIDMGKMPLEFDIRRSRARVSYCAIFFRQRNSFDEIHKNTMDNFYGLTVVRNLLL